MVNERSKREGRDGSALVNFQFSTRAAPIDHSNRRRRRHDNRHQHNNRQQYRRTKEDRASARRKASSAMFYLHSSPDHAFVISRRCPSKQRQHEYSFQSADHPVSWASVRIVKQYSSATHEACPICLDSFCCARITKCGHTFCLPCLIHHIQTFAALNPYADAPKCPCCAIPLHLEDVRPVSVVTVSAPAAGNRIRLVKLHRVKDCPSPFLPLPDHPKRSSPHAAPRQTDADARYSRFCYVDPPTYHRLLRDSLVELDGLGVESDLEQLCQGLAREFVSKELQQALEECPEEEALMERFAGSNSGFYQQQPKYLMTRREDWVVPAPLSSDQLATAMTTFDDPVHVRRDFRSDSISEHSHQSASDAPQSPRRPRCDSVVSTESGRSRGSMCPSSGSMHADQDESPFYQAEDGTLCFLSGFNMKCLQAEFSSGVPGDEAFQSAVASGSLNCVSPLPDAIEGRIFEVERLHLTAEIRSRLRFLSHVPLYADVLIVEVSLNVLSGETKKRFKKEFAKRKQARSAKLAAEARSDARERRKEEARVNELKARWQQIDPEDEFFLRASVTEPGFTGEEFGPSVLETDGSIAQDHTPQHSSTSTPALSFSQICKEGGVFPTLGSSVHEDNFPALPSSPPARAVDETRLWGNGRPADVHSPSTVSAGKRKAKGKKTVLFSTGGHRGTIY